MLRRAFAFRRRGGSKKNLVAMSESIHDARPGGVVGRHLHFHPVANREANKTLAHLAGDMRENEMVVRKGDAKHGSRKHRCDGALYCNGFFRIYYVHLRGALSNSAAPKLWSRAAQSIRFLPAKTGERTLPASAVGTRTVCARTRFVNG